MKWRIIIGITCILSTGLVAQINFSDSNLPIFVIDTDSLSIMDEPKVNAHLGVIYNEGNRRNSLSDDFNHYDGQIGIELRGATSQTLFEKKGYALETRLEDESNNNVSLLGLAKENDWVLHGPYSDKTLMRNALTYCLAGKLMDYAPGIRFVELVINDDYKGVYLLTDKIKRDKGRVDISKLTSDIKDGEALTGGYILKIDKSEGGQTDGFFSQLPAKSDGWQETFYQYHYPKPRDINQEQKDYIESIVNEIDQTFNAESFKDPSLGFRRLLDEDSAIDYLIINELSKNPDAYRLSTYLYKDKDSIDTKVHFGPVWDYNLAFGNVNYCTDGNHEGFVVREFNVTCPDDYWQINFWWDKMLSDTLFAGILKRGGFICVKTY